MQLLDGEPQPVQNSRTEILDKHICMLDQTSENRLSLRCLQVKRDRFFVPIAGEKISRLNLTRSADKRRAPTSGVVSAIRVLHLDDARAHVAQHHARMRAGKRAR
ncbi:hypothetical protein GALL_416780 [mine drainage metagenome]|uniref:Uncharacterized protein n=1 Tax=mine drainage metagenome TaxID=410659 RepID=A0A1J5QKT7_9ZZZZ